MTIPYTKTELEDLYINKKLSWVEIAKLYNSYPNKIRRQSKKWNIYSRSKSEAQSTALSSNRHKHPTKGTHRSDETKMKIGEKIADIWDNLTTEEKEQRAQQAKDQWDKKSPLAKKQFHQAAMIAVRKSSKEGSKLEKYIHLGLTKAGYQVEYHKKHLILNENLHLDIFLPKVNVAIEVDGISHFEPVWGWEAFRRTQKADTEKKGLILSKNLVFIQIKAIKTISAKYMRDTLQKLLNTLENIKQKYPDRKDRYILIGD